MVVPALSGIRFKSGQEMGSTELPTCPRGLRGLGVRITRLIRQRRFESFSRHWEHGISRLGAVEACCAHNAKVPGSKPGVANGEHGSQYTAINQKTLRLKIFRHCASQVRILPRVYALVCKRSKQVCYYVDSTDKVAWF